MLPFYTPFGFLVFSGGIKWEHWPENGLTDLTRFNAESHDSMHGYFVRLLKAWQIASINQFHYVILVVENDDEENDICQGIFISLYKMKKIYITTKKSLQNITRYFM